MGQRGLVHAANAWAATRFRKARGNSALEKPYLMTNIRQHFRSNIRLPELPQRLYSL